MAGGAGADWTTCLRLLERAAAAAADVVRDGAASTVASSTRVRGGVSSFRAANERDKKIEKKRLCLIWPPTGNSNTTTNQKHTHATQEVNVRRSPRAYLCPASVRRTTGFSTVIARGREGGGGEDDLEPPMAAAWATIVCRDHHFIIIHRTLICAHLIVLVLIALRR